MKTIKSLLFFLITIVSAQMLTSCSDDDDDSARYYVKYEVTIQTQHVNPDRTISYTDEKGNQTFVNSEWIKLWEWEGTYGPVNKNFVASLDCSTAKYDDTVIHARIYVSREKEPFVIKAEGTNTLNSKSLSLTYKIDF
ncbi:MAG: hypothetical protein K6F98_07580 [Bacteroidales bacterium]|nr:hypothetical protein [Bacteroidales bacterium]